MGRRDRRSEPPRQVERRLLAPAADRPGGIPALLASVRAGNAVELRSQAFPAARSRCACVPPPPAEAPTGGDAGSAAGPGASPAKPAAHSTHLVHSGLWMKSVFSKGVDPVTTGAILVVTETDITALMAAEAALRATENARLQTESALLRSLLPASIVERLLAGESDIADVHDSVTVLFAGAPPARHSLAVEFRLRGHSSSPKLSPVP